jgi:hypothetical protein
MRVDTDTYVWGVAKIVIERKTERESPSIDIRLIGEEMTSAGASLYVWGEGRHGEREMPTIVLVENGVERVLVPGGPLPKDDAP